MHLKGDMNKDTTLFDAIHRIEEELRPSTGRGSRTQGFSNWLDEDCSIEPIRWG